MSSDLLAEFDSFYSAPQLKNTSNTSASQDLHALGSNVQNVTSGTQAFASPWHQAYPTSGNGGSSSTITHIREDRDQSKSQGDTIWDGFEALSSGQPSQSVPRMQQHAAQHQSKAVGQGVINDLRSPGDGQLNRTGHSSNFTDTRSSKRVSPSDTQIMLQKSIGGDVLFDADDVEGGEEDDDFGDFESVQPDGVRTSTIPSNDVQQLVTIGTISPTVPFYSHNPNSRTSFQPYIASPKAPSFQERNLFADLKISSPQSSTVVNKPNAVSRSATPVTAWPIYESKTQEQAPYINSSVSIADLDEDWGDFEDLPPEKPTTQPGLTTNTATAWAWDEEKQVDRPIVSLDSNPPPTNIPPPSVLLSLFPALFDLPQSTLFKAVASQPFSLKNRIMSDPTTIDFLRAYLLVATVAARIIAGRKLRWKRDTHLSQAMKIGPSAAGGKSGMKLTGVDKSEVTKEDRELDDVVRVWKEQLGRLRSAVAVANTSMRDNSAHLVIPEIGEVIQVKTQAGAMTAPRQCLICGLKRDERVMKVDFEVEDSFGEWWVDHWGHRACKNLWQEHETKLKQR